MPRQPNSELVQKWFQKGYGSKDIATFLLCHAVAENPGFYKSFPERIEESFTYFHDEVVKIIYKK